MILICVVNMSTRGPCMWYIAYELQIMLLKKDRLNFRVLGVHKGPVIDLAAPVRTMQHYLHGE